MPTVAEQFIEVLVQAGVKRIYGIVGDSLNPVVDAVRRTEAPAAREPPSGEQAPCARPAAGLHKRLLRCCRGSPTCGLRGASVPRGPVGSGRGGGDV